MHQGLSTLKTMLKSISVMSLKGIQHYFLTSVLAGISIVMEDNTNSTLILFGEFNLGHLSLTQGLPNNPH